MGQIKNIKLHIVTDIKVNPLRNHQNDHTKEEPSCHLREPVQRWSHGCYQRLQPRKTQRVGKGEKPRSHQSNALLEISRLCAGEFCLEALLLVFDQRRDTISSRFPSPSSRDCTCHIEESYED